MEILYWSPQDESEEAIYEKMKKMYEHIHTYKDEEIYGQSFQPTDEVLTFDENREENIFEDIRETEDIK